MKFKMKELEQFVHDHIQQKIDNNELYLTGISMTGDVNAFKREFEIYQNTLLEGIVNGIIMCDGEIEGNEIVLDMIKQEEKIGNYMISC